MKTEQKYLNDERLEKLLRSARPEPDGEFAYSVRSALAALPSNERAVPRIPKAVIIIAALLMALILGTGVAYASGAFRNLFGSAISNVQERIDEFDATYDEKREQMEHMDEWDAAMLDMEMDYESMKNAGDLGMMIEAEENAILFEEEVDGVTLMSFSVVKFDNMNWVIYCGLNAVQGYEFGNDITFIIDGKEFGGWITDLAKPEPEAENPVIYECYTGLDWEKHNSISDITVELDGRSWDLRYHWNESRLAKPGEEAVPYVEPTEIPPGTPLTVIPVNAPSDQIVVSLSKAEVTNDILILRLEFIRSGDSDITSADLRNVTFSIGGVERSDLVLDKGWNNGLLFKEDNEQHRTLMMQLPVPLSELSGEDLTFGFKLNCIKPIGLKIYEYEYKLKVD